MTFAFPAFHEEQIEVAAGLTAGDVVAAMAAVGWRGDVASADGATVECSTGLSAWSWSEKIIVRRVGSTTLLVRSQCELPTQCVDWGKNAKNVQKLIAAIGAARGGAPLG